MRVLSNYRLKKNLQRFEFFSSFRYNIQTENKNHAKNKTQMQHETKQNHRITKKTMKQKQCKCSVENGVLPENWFKPPSVEFELTLHNDLIFPSTSDDKWPAYTEVPAKLKRFRRFSLPVDSDDEVNLLLTFLRRRLVTAESEQVDVFKALVSLPKAKWNVEDRWKGAYRVHGVMKVLVIFYIIC